MYRPDNARQEILEILRHQYKSGNAVLTWLPIDETRYSDQPFWLIWAVTELIKETGDFSIIDEVTDYQDGGKGRMMEHLKAAVRGNGGRTNPSTRHACSGQAGLEHSYNWS